MIPPPSTSVAISKNLKLIQSVVKKFGLQCYATDLELFLSHSAGTVAPFHFKLHAIFDSVEPLEQISMWEGSNSDRNSTIYAPRERERERERSKICSLVCSWQQETKARVLSNQRRWFDVSDVYLFH